jgi:phage-related protein (TIGR01555 family)
MSPPRPRLKLSLAETRQFYDQRARDARQGQTNALAMHDRNLINSGLVPFNEQGALVGRATDAFVNAAARTGFGTPSVAEAADYLLVRWSYDYQLMYTLYRNHWISRRIVDMPAQDMVRAWPRLTSDLDPKDLTQLDRVIRNTKTKAKLLETIKWARLFGGAGALIVIDGQENRLDEPLDYDTVELGSYRGLIPFDRWVGIYPDTNIAHDIERPLEFNLPEHYRVQSLGGARGFRIHASRILRFTGPTVPAPEYQAQMYWGISVLEIAYEAIRMFDNMLWNMLNLSFRANLLGIKFDELAQALSGVSMNSAALQAFYQRMEAMNQMVSNNSMMIFPKDGGLEQTQYAFTGCSDLLEQFRLVISGAAEIPEMRLFGHSPAGMGVKDDPAERLYEEKISADQEDQLRPALDQLYPVICMSTLGEIPEDLDLTFPSIRIPTEDERATLAKNIGDSVVSMFGAGIINKRIALNELKQSSDSTGIWTNITDEDVQSAEEEDIAAKEVQEQQQQQLLAGGAPGEEGEGEEGETKNEGEPSPQAPAKEIGAGGAGAKGEKVQAKQQQMGRPSGRALVAKAADAEVDDPVAAHAEEHRDLDFAGIPLSIEYEKGERRQIHNDRGQLVFDNLVKHPYGFIRNTVGRDGDEIDIILGPVENAPNVYIIDMQDLGPDVDKREDEDKIMLGFPAEEDAKRAFLGMYPPDFLRAIEEVTLEDFINRLEDAHGAELPDLAELGEVGPLAEARDFEESKIKRGQPENAGQFASKGESEGKKKA